METYKILNKNKEWININVIEKGLATITGYSHIKMDVHDGKLFFVEVNGGPYVFTGMDFNDFLMTYKQFLDSPTRKIVTKLVITLEGIEIRYEEKEKKKEK